PHGHATRADDLLKGTRGNECPVDRERDYIWRLQTHRAVDLRVRHERHLDFARDSAKPGDAQMDVSCREAALLDTAFHSNAHSGNIENHTINDRSRWERDLTKTQEFGPSASGGHLGHTD